MVRNYVFAVFVAFNLPIMASAQAPLFKWTTGQTLVYNVKQTTTATDTAENKTQETTTTLELTKRWQVRSVDQTGVATLAMSLDKLRMETKTPTGEVMLFDSANPAKSTPALRDEMTKFVAVPLSVVRIDNRGQLVEVKESKFGPASRLESDLPFKIVLPTHALAPELNWTRDYKIKLEPPQGAGESYDAQQKLLFKSLTNGIAVFGVTTELKTQPGSSADMIPLIPLLPVGEVAFDVSNGRLKAMRYEIKREVTGHSGDGSKYVFVSKYAEDLVGQ